MNVHPSCLTYVILRHSFATGQSSSRTTEDHTDWMFDNGKSLWTWASSNLLDEPDHPFENRAFAKLADHRRHYLDYEGPISHDRGRVTRLERGEYQLISHTEDRFEVKLCGVRQGILVLQRILELPAAPGSDWKGGFRPTRLAAS